MKPNCWETNCGESSSGERTAMGSTTMSSIVERAFLRAKIAHEGQTRKITGESYIEHPCRVAMAVAGCGVSGSCLAAAYLHDVLEDTTMGIDDFPLRTRQLLDLLSRRKGEHKHRFIARIVNASDPEALLIKAADRIDNLSGDIIQLGEQWVETYLASSRLIVELGSKSRMREDVGGMVGKMLERLRDVIAVKERELQPS